MKGNEVENLGYPLIPGEAVVAAPIVHLHPRQTGTSPLRMGDTQLRGLIVRLHHSHKQNMHHTAMEFLQVPGDLELAHAPTVPTEHRHLLIYPTQFLKCRL
jgi:hypothetical protein